MDAAYIWSAIGLCLMLLGLIYLMGRGIAASSYAIHAIWIYTLFQIAAYMLLPQILRYLSDHEMESDVFVGMAELSETYLVQTNYVLAWALCFWCFWTTIGKQGNRTALLRESDGEPLIRWFTALSIPVNLLSVWARFFGDGLSPTELLFPLGSLLSLTSYVFPFFGLAYFWRKKRSRSWTWVSVVAVAAYLLMAVPSGVRGLLVNAALFACYSLVLVTPKRASTLGAGLVVVVLTGIVANQLMGLRSLTAEELLAGAGPIDTAPKSTLVEEVEYRYGEASRLSVAFVRRYYAHETAHLRPTLNSLYAPFPRAIFPDKPIPGSLDADIFNMGAYLIMSDIRGTWWNMSEFLPGPHQLWEGGLPWYFLSAALSAAWVGFLCIFVLGARLESVPFVVLFLKPWGYMQPQVLTYDIPLQLFQVLCPLLLVILTRRQLSRAASQLRRTVALLLNQDPAARRNRAS